MKASDAMSPHASYREFITFEIVLIGFASVLYRPKKGRQTSEYWTLLPRRVGNANDF